jgi:beta-glucosidase
MPMANSFYLICTQASQKGKIGITLVSDWVMPLYDTELDHRAAQRAIDFIFGW